MENCLLGLREPYPEGRLGQRLLLAGYQRDQALVCPDECDWSPGVADWQMFRNNQLGSCGIAGPFHQIMGWGWNARRLLVPLTDDQATAEYSAVAGYDPLTGSGDNGVVLSDVCTRWQRVGLAGHQIQGWVQGQVGRLRETLWGAACFGGCQLGLALPLTAADQLAAGKPWTLTSRWLRRGKPGSWGLHCVYLAGYDLKNGIAKLVTWGAVQICTLEWLDYYLATVDYPVSAEWLTDSGVSPSGLKQADLLQDLAVLASAAAA